MNEIFFFSTYAFEWNFVGKDISICREKLKRGSCTPRRTASIFLLFSYSNKIPPPFFCIFFIILFLAPLFQILRISISQQTKPTRLVNCRLFCLGHVRVTSGNVILILYTLLLKILLPLSHYQVVYIC